MILTVIHCHLTQLCLKKKERKVKVWLTVPISPLTCQSKTSAWKRLIFILEDEMKETHLCFFPNTIKNVIIFCSLHAAYTFDVRLAHDVHSRQAVKRFFFFVSFDYLLAHVCHLQLEEAWCKMSKW